MVFKMFGAQYNPIRLLMDSDGRICGGSPATAEHRYLYIMNFEGKVKSVCVKECIRFDYNKISSNQQSGSQPSQAPRYFEDLPQPKKRPGSSDPLGYDESIGDGSISEVSYLSYVQSLELKCAPTKAVASCRHSKEADQFIYDSRPQGDSLCVPVTPKAHTHAYSTLFMISTQPHGLGGYMLIVISMCSGLVLCVLLSRCLSSCNLCVLWTSIVVASLSLLLVGVLLLFTSGLLNNPLLMEGLSMLKKLGFIFKTIAGYIESKISMVFMLGAGALLLAVLLPVSAVSQPMRVKTTGFMLKAANRQLEKSNDTLVFHFFSFVSVLATLLSLSWASGIIESHGDPFFDAESGDPLPLRRLGWMSILWGYCMAVFVWVFIFEAELVGWIASDAAVTDYFVAHNGAIDRGVSNVAPHIGSVALGSLLVPVNFCLKAALHPFYWLFSVESDNERFKKVKAVLCVNSWYERHLLPLKETGFCMQSVSGEAFLDSSKTFAQLEQSQEAVFPHSNALMAFQCFVGVVLVASLNQTVCKILASFFDCVYLNRYSNSLSAVFRVSLVQGFVFMRIIYALGYGTLTCFYLQQAQKKPVQHEVMKDLRPSGRQSPDYLPLADPAKH